MKTREFDPVLSAGLRNELEALADGAAGSPQGRALHAAVRGRPWVVTVVTAVVLLIATIGVLRLVAPATVPAPAQSGAPTAREGVIADPLQQITDPDDPAYLDTAPVVLLHSSGRGPVTLPIDVPAGVQSVRPLIRCAPDADFRIAVGKAYWTHCSAQTTPGYGDIPVTSGRHELTLTIPSGVAWRLVTIATPDTATSRSPTVGR